MNNGNGNDDRSQRITIPAPPPTHGQIDILESVHAPTRDELAADPCDPTTPFEAVVRVMAYRQMAMGVDLSQLRELVATHVASERRAREELADRVRKLENYCPQCEAEIDA
jgi:hypothetical protein